MFGDADVHEAWVLLSYAAAVAERMGELAELGFDMFQVGFDRFPDTEAMELFMAEVLPRFGS